MAVKNMVETVVSQAFVVLEAVLKSNNIVIRTRIFGPTHVIAKRTEPVNFVQERVISCDRMSSRVQMRVQQRKWSGRQKFFNEFASYSWRLASRLARTVFGGMQILSLNL